MKGSPSDAKPDELYGELASLPALGSERLKERWRILYDAEPPPRISEDLLRRAIAYRLQERAFGGLKPSTRRLLQRIAEDARPRSCSATPTRKLSAGAVLIREWQGTNHQGTVLQGGVRFRRKLHCSPSGAPPEITRNPVFTPLFFW